MKKQTVLSLLLIFTLFITAVPMTAFAAGAGVKIDDAFPDANFRAFVVEFFDKDRDGYLTDEELDWVTIVSVNSRKIQSLKGIELFPNLYELRCLGNKLTQLDLSKNTALETLDCDNNQLTTLDLSNNTSLYSITCHRNQLTSLILPNSNQLVKLGCYDNQLTSLNLRKATYLSSLYCGKNQLTSLDVTRNTQLKSLDCAENQLTTLDVSRNTELVRFNCFDNQITTLDLSEHTKLTNVKVPQKINLTTNSDGTLSINLNQLASFVTLPAQFDLSQGTSLKGKFIYNEEFPWNNIVQPAAFDTGTLEATWNTDNLGQYIHCVEGTWEQNSDLQLGFGVTEETEIPTPTVTKGNDPVTGKPKLTWKAVFGAVKYEIYRYDSASNTYVKMISTTGTTFTNTSAVAGKTYSYKVKAIGSSSSVTPSITAPISVTCKYPTPKVTGSNNPATGKNVLNWAKVDGATKYEIYRYDSASSSYIKLITTTGTTFTNTSAKPGYIYYYKVKAIGSVDAAASNFSDKVKLTCKYPTPKVTGSNTTTGKPKLSWEKVDGATKYEIYRYDSASNSYIKLITTTGTTFTNTSAKPGYIYYYKVKAVGSVAAAASNFSDKVKLTCKCAAPKVTGSNTTTGKPKLTWEKVTGATKYEIYRYDSASSSYIKLITTTGTTFTHTSAKPGYIYYYKVKALGATTASDSAMSEKVKVTCK